jgi:flavin-dependent dehydrogenase
MIMCLIESFDVIIIGGGPAGASAAITLARRGFRTVIIERSTYPKPRIGETLPPLIRSLLITLGVWQQFLKDNHLKSFAFRSAWGKAEPQDSNHIFNPYGCGWHVDRASFDHMLARAAVGVGAKLLTQCHIKHFSESQRSGWEIVIQQDKQTYCLRSPFLIDATGQTSAVPTGLQRSFRVVDRLIGIVQFLVRDAEPYTLIEAEPYGWWYSAPLPNRRLVVAYMTDADLFAAERSDPNDYWHRHLYEAEFTSARIGAHAVPTQPKIVSAASLIRQPVSGINWLAAGDAGVAFDPLSGRGVYSALKSGILSAEAVIARIDGSSKSFVEYAGWVNRQFLNYLQMRKTIYRKEQRWARSPFWRRRHEEQF